MKSELRSKIAYYEAELIKAQKASDNSKVLSCEHEIDNLIDILENN